MMTIEKRFLSNVIAGQKKLLSLSTISIDPISLIIKPLQNGSSLFHNPVQVKLKELCISNLACPVKYLSNEM